MTTTVNFKELGLVNGRELYKRAVEGGFAAGGFNFNNMEQLQSIIQAATELKSPVVLQVSKGARNV
jgi:fructose-bisphosphate aldolase class II